MAKCLNSDSKIIYNTEPIPKTATSMTLQSNSKEWCKHHFAIGLSTGEVQVYNSNNKITFKTSHIKSDLLSLAFSVEVLL